jgi:hypothetical protein
MLRFGGVPRIIQLVFFDGKSQFNLLENGLYSVGDV